jgi:dCTP deaminase
MILTGTEVERMVGQGRITIHPFDPACLQPNSYDLHLGDTLVCYEAGQVYNRVLDPRVDSPTYTLPLTGDGMILEPNRVYLGSTVERVGSREFVPRIDGKSSLGRLGVLVHLTAGFVDLGFEASLTLEIAVVQPVRLYAGMPICQVSFSATLGDRTIQYRGRYRDQEGPTSSRMWRGWGDGK